MCVILTIFYIGEFTERFIVKYNKCNKCYIIFHRRHFRESWENSVIINQNEQKIPNKSYIYNLDPNWCVKRKL